ncbi:hypothetical protein F5Y15DRAFT_382014 [Xylariaceae sp. FL0016]|nr:hypothetical protein F5Y15DRAFT_382014 [Xylariaceae sp. FL0016]
MPRSLHVLAMQVCNSFLSATSEQDVGNLPLCSTMQSTIHINTSQYSYTVQIQLGYNVPSTSEAPEQGRIEWHTSPTRMTASTPSPSGSLHVVGQTFSVDHVIIRSKHTFEETREALETSIPTLDITFGGMLRAGDRSGALSALEALPPLNRFSTPPGRDFGLLLGMVGEPSKAVQYEIGNPLTATRMNQYATGVGLYVPIRVLLRVNEKGEAVFEYDRIESVVRKFGSPDACEIAKQLDRDLMDVLGKVSA